ncbi:MAG: aminoacyl-tRNA hydrolase [Phenylobacterium sp.]|uniref:aminoacyl-tRNA hydrolase n=1 Tax=Phenylobacterium sp. TaxID=1871053 RepID=UPI0027344D6F|nr:aminoacyl-tRNA hydrolase [Phenylobacterium sp.]MDP3172835.1 aminoacyl-tRNA hydrolase [Phenylobacterium sp.]
MKQVIVVNQALNLPAGKMAAQVAHAAVGAFLHADREHQVGWLEAGMPKIVLRCASAEDLLALAQAAEDAGLATMLVRDAGRTVVEAGTATCVGIGPGPVADVDALTSTLKLVR